MFHSGCRPSVASSKCRNFSVGLECPHPAHNSFRGIFYHKFLCAISTVQCYKDESTSSRNQMESIISYVDQRIFIGTSVHPFGPSWGPVEKLGPFPSCPNDALSDGTIFTPIPQILKNTSSEPPCVVLVDSFLHLIDFRFKNGKIMLRSPVARKRSSADSGEVESAENVKTKGDEGADERLAHGTRRSRGPRGLAALGSNLQQVPTL